MHKAIIFDLGGVIEKINPLNVISSFKALGMENADHFFSLLKQSSICSSFETGKLNRNEFIKHLKSKCNDCVTKSQIELAWCDNQKGITLNTLNVLNSLKQQELRLFLLSNTNPIHMQKLEENLFLQHGTHLSSLFDDVYYSYVMRLRKPDPMAYKTVLTANGLSATECIYVDDLERNIKAAETLGFYCIHHKTNDEIKEDKFIISG